jgi:hypothetical protein
MRAQVLCVLVGVGLLGGCHSRRGSLDECLQERIRIVERMADLLEDVTGDSSAEEVRSKLEALLREQASIETRESKLKKEELTPETMKRLAAKERESLHESLSRLEKAREQAAKCNAEVAEVLKELGDRLPRLPPKIVPGD